jgi:hypothetical protein
MQWRNRRHRLSSGHNGRVACDYPHNVRVSTLFDNDDCDCERITEQIN